ncbi:MAG TPA: ABC transporter permease [Gemmatimonadaceae bacterium]|jgi:predicted permease
MPNSNPLWHRYLRFWRSDPRAELEDELAFHVQARVDDYVAFGMDVEHARLEAARRVGDLARVRADCLRIDRQVARRRSMSDIGRGAWADLRVAVRQLRRHRALTIAAFVCLTLGIGANTAIFSVVDAVLFRPLPFRDPARLVMVGEGLPIISDENFGVISAPNYLDYKTLDGPVFASSAAFQSETATLTGGGSPEQVSGLEASASLFRVLGAVPALGRDFLPNADAVGAPEVVILADAFWRSRFGADPAIVGRPIVLDGRPRTVIGVMPPGFAFPLPGLHMEPAKYFAPFPITTAIIRQRGNSYETYVVARLAAGVTVERARTAVNAIALRMPELHPEVYPRTMQVTADAVPLRERLVVGVRRSLLVLLGAVGVVLLIACINVSGLLLARAAARGKEIAVRTAIGATRGRLVQQFLAESAVLVALGAAGGLVVAQVGARALVALAPDGLLSGYRIDVDGRVLALTLGVAVVAAVAFSLVPVLHGNERALPVQLREEGRGASTGRARQRGRRALVVSEMALALVLAAAAGLLVRSFVKALRIDPGFVPGHLLSFQVVLPRYRYPGPERVLEQERQIIERLTQLPGVVRATAATNLPVTHPWVMAVSPEGVQVAKLPLTSSDVVMPGYFEAMKIPLLEGRTFDAHDVLGADPVVIVDQQFARRFYPGQSAVGHRIKWGSATSSDPWGTIVGVVHTVKAQSLDEESMPETYSPALQHGQDSALVDFALRAQRYVVRTTGDPLAMVAAARSVVNEIDPELPVTQVETGEALVAQSVAGRRFETLLLGAFAALALVLAAVGIYGLIAYSVVQRQREIGIRIAIGATAGGVVRLVLREGAWTAVAGAALGLVGAVVLTRFMRSLLFEVGALDAVTFIAATGLLISVALVASWIPARRAARVDAVMAMRGE